MLHSAADLSQYQRTVATRRVLHLLFSHSGPLSLKERVQWVQCDSCSCKKLYSPLGSGTCWECVARDLPEYFLFDGRASYFMPLILVRLRVSLALLRSPTSLHCLTLDLVSRQGMFQTLPHSPRAWSQSCLPGDRKETQDNCEILRYAVRAAAGTQAPSLIETGSIEES